MIKLKMIMKKMRFLLVAAVAAMVASCGSSSSEKSSNDSTATDAQSNVSEVVKTDANSAEVVPAEDAVISYDGKLFDVPAGAVLTPATIKATAHPTLIEFGATWCGPCKQAKPIVENLAGKYDGKAEFLYVDIDACPEIAKEFGVGQAIPVVVVAKADGTFEVVEGLEAIKTQLEAKLQNAIAK